ncbi:MULTISPECIES: TonB-dependent receptor [Gammaproteobacteria]|uniref:TonB-dependent receptor family protein n=1 Tax=Gammaproteobacteria TaxID=1236 RepID=UPI000DD05DDE|nr:MULTISPECIES: TonB-dependent receptor [Gammaproteobacteria]RTE86753.1 TonB-dependent receptor [Aliidiomarina sp. B3213]TCZ90693.1 TonB-dependent receptor [Lysobacter sp. N42]
MRCNSKKMGLAILVSPFLFNSSAVVGQSENDSNDNIETITVTASRTETPWLNTPASVSRVEVEQQLPGQRSDVAEILEGISGLQVDTRYNFAQDTRITLRGFGARAAFGVRGVRLRLDGIPLSMPDGQAQTSSILIDEPEYVEVLRGPLAAIYGNAAGGVIDLRSQMPLVSSAFVHFSQGSASREKSRFQGTYRRGEQAFRVDYAEFSSAGDRQVGAIEREQLALRGFHDGENIRITIRVDDNDAPEIEDPLALTASVWRENPSQVHPRAFQFKTRKSIAHQQQSITLEGVSIPWQVAFWNGEREILQYLPFAGDDPTSSGAVIDLSRAFYGVSATYDWNVPSSNDWVLTWGADFASQEDTRKGYVNNEGVIGDLRRDETGEVESSDLSLISNFSLTERWHWTAGVRTSSMTFSVSDRYITAQSPDDSGRANIDEWSWSQGLNYQVSSAVSAYISAGQGFESPTLTEMAYRNTGTGLNTDLRPSLIEQTEIGLKWYNPNFRGQASLFLIDSEDDIVVDQSNDGRTTYRNAAQTERTGFEFESNWNLSEQWVWDISYTYLDATYQGAVAESGNRLPGIAQTNLYNRVTWFSPFGLQFKLNQTYRSKIATNDDNSEFAPSATVYDLSISSQYTQNRWVIEPWFRIDNLTDKKYVGSVVVNQGSGRSFEPAPGRVWMIGFNARFEP